MYSKLMAHMEDFSSFNDNKVLVDILLVGSRFIRSRGSLFHLP